MANPRKVWLVTNEASGSNDEKSLDVLRGSFAAAGMSVAHHCAFPAEPLPSPAILDAAGIDLVAIFAGDGTLNAAIDALAGWGGAVLVLDGGTMNLLYHRLFGELPREEVLAAVGSGAVHMRRPGIIACVLGNAYAGLLAGPGTAWNDVREAMRAGNILGMASEATAALSVTVAGDMVRCVEPPIGRPEGYPLLLIDPRDDALSLTAYYAESAGDYLEQAAALVQRDFRQGPHELLGRGAAFTIASAGDPAFGLLLDGEPVDSAGAIRFSLARCEVDLLATQPDG